MAYATPDVNDTKGIYEISNYLNTVSDGVLFPGLVGAIWFIIFISLLRLSPSRAFTTASFICSIIAMLLTILGLFSDRIMYLLFVLVAVGAVWIKLENKG